LQTSDYDRQVLDPRGPGRPRLLAHGRWCGDQAATDAEDAEHVAVGLRPGDRRASHLLFKGEHIGDRGQTNKKLFDKKLSPSKSVSYFISELPNRVSSFSVRILLLIFKVEALVFEGE